MSLKGISSHKRKKSTNSTRMEDTKTSSSSASSHLSSLDLVTPMYQLHKKAGRDWMGYVEEKMDNLKEFLFEPPRTTKRQHGL